MRNEDENNIQKPSISEQSNTNLHRNVNEDVDEIIPLSKNDLRKDEERCLSEDDCARDACREDHTTSLGTYNGETNLTSRRSKSARQQGFMSHNSNNQNTNCVFTIADLQEEMK